MNQMQRVSLAIYSKSNRKKTTTMKVSIIVVTDKKYNVCEKMLASHTKLFDGDVAVFGCAFSLVTNDEPNA